MSTLRTNALEGVDAKNSITIVAGAGNVTTTNVQEGLGKSWINMNGTGTPAARDSFNVSSLTDNATGDYSPNFSNSMGNVNYAVSFAGGENTVTWGLYLGHAGLGNATGSHRFLTTAPDNTLTDTAFASLVVLGDLA